MTNEKKQPDNVLLSYLNINSPRFRVLGSKFLPYRLAISETKINEEFPNSFPNFQIRPKSGKD